MKKNKNSYDLTPVSETHTYFVMFDSGDGKEHEHTIKSTETIAGMLYSINYSDCRVWAENIRGTKAIEILNTGNGYVIISTCISKSFVDYSDMFIQTTFLKTIEKLESKNSYSMSIVAVNEILTDML